MSLRNVGIAAALVLIVAVIAGWFFHTRKPSVSAPQPSVAAVPPAPPVDPFEQRLDDIVARYRKMIVLLEDDTDQSDEHGRISLVGKIIFQENHRGISQLSDELTGDILNAGDFSKPLANVVRFLDLVENKNSFHDADKLAFREVISDIAETLSGIKSNSKEKQELAGRVDLDRKALAEIQSLYEKELDKIFARFDTRGIEIRREAWDQYVAFLRTLFKREDILKGYAVQIAQVNQNGSKAEQHRDSDLEVYGNNLPPKTFVLTFDDGPHARYTDQILNILRKHNVKSVFFELGENLGSLKQNKVVPTRASAAAVRLIESGETIGSHGYSHNVLPKMSDSEVAKEFDETNRMLKSVINVDPVLFRPPYGERDVKVLAAIGAHNMKSVMWNIDSDDWADPVSKSIANRVIRDARRLNHGIILLHDIHERTIDAVPLIIETLQNEGYRFLSWNGQTFVDDGPRITETNEKPEAMPVLYRESWAVIIGIDEYPKWPRLHYAVNDAKGMSELLINNFKFKPDHVLTLLNGDATREKILSVLGDTLADPKKVQKDDRVFVFFAGHGATRKLPSGRDLGYIIPYDADLESFQGQAISMTNFQDISESIPARHVLFVMDSCYSGLALTRSGGTSNYLREVSQRSSRQMLTAGGANEEVSDTGPNGHSIFSWTVLQGLEGRADLNSDGFISATELASFVAPGVSGLAHQTPAFGNLPGSEGGEFIFELHPETEFLSEVSAQLDQVAIQLNSQIDQIRREIATKSARNDQLRQQLVDIQSKSSSTAPAPSAKAPSTATAHLNKGFTLFQEKRYQEALDEFLTAAKIDPSSALAANNAGFMYTKLGKMDLAIQWTEKAIKIDPKRAVAYANLADAYYQVNRFSDARRTYQTYLEIAPKGTYADTARARVASLN
jgi:peptidoglycan/xylan/chitin deacetylase (PgdA/CDA1 family)/uncharacterized caspase-like protein